MSKKESAAVTSTRITVRGTIIVAVIGLISALVLGYWQFVLKPSDSNQAIETQYIGRVIDINTQQTIAGAKITLDLEGVPPIIYTDSEGVYRFKVVIKSNISGQVRVDAQGYQTYTRYISLSPDVQTIEDIRLNLVQQPQPTENLVPTSTIVVSSAPIIDSIDFPQLIVCDGRKYDVPIRFHDLDGDANRIQWELLYSKKQTPLYADAISFYIDSQAQIQGATYNDFIEWHIPGDEVKIRVYIEDRTGLNGSKDFEFKCSN